MVLIVKGSTEVARAQCNARGTPYEGLRPAPGGKFSHVQVGEAYEVEVCKWVCEPGEAPYPEGTLLFYQ